MNSTTHTTRYTFTHAGSTISAFASSEEQARACCSFDASRGDGKLVAFELVAYTFGEKSAAVAAELSSLTGTTWLASPNSSESLDVPFTLRRVSDNLSLWLDFGRAQAWNGGKAGVGLKRPFGTNRHWVEAYWPSGEKVETPSIGFSAEKTPAVVAKDILRRLLPDAEAVLPLILAAVAAHEAHDVRVSTASKIAEGLDSVSGLHFSGCHGEIKVEGCLSVADAVRLHALLSSLEEIRKLNALCFDAETVAHLKGYENEILPLTDAVRALAAKV
jgi:hypothetical protein